MALVKCPECGKDVSDSAKACPHCGYSGIVEIIDPLSKHNIRMMKIMAVPVVIFFVILYMILEISKSADLNSLVRFAILFLMLSLGLLLASISNYLTFDYYKIINKSGPRWTIAKWTRRLTIIFGVLFLVLMLISLFI